MRAQRCGNATGNLQAGHHNRIPPFPTHRMPAAVRSVSESIHPIPCFDQRVLDNHSTRREIKNPMIGAHLAMPTRALTSSPAASMSMTQRPPLASLVSDAHTCIYVPHKKTALSSPCAPQHHHDQDMVPGQSSALVVSHTPPGGGQEGTWPSCEPAPSWPCGARPLPVSSPTAHHEYEARVRTACTCTAYSHPCNDAGFVQLYSPAAHDSGTTYTVIALQPSAILPPAPLPPAMIWL